MGLFSWFQRDKASSREATDEIALGFAKAVVHWCSPGEIGKARSSLHIPPSAVNFEEELFYLYVFLVVTAIESAYADSDELKGEIAGTFIEYVQDAIESGDVLQFRASSDAMHSRYLAYLGVRKRGTDAFIDQLPFMFLVTNGVCPSARREDMADLGLPLLHMPVWLGQVLKQLVVTTRGWRNRSRFKPETLE